MLVLAVYIVTDIEGFKTAYICKAYKPVLDGMQSCPYGVRSDFCYTIAPINFSNASVLPVIYSYNWTAFKENGGK